MAWPPPNPPPAETKERYVEPATDSSISGTDAAPEPNGGANNARADSPPSLETEGWVAWPPPIRLPRQDRSSSPSLKVHHSNERRFVSGSVRPR